MDLLARLENKLSSSSKLYVAKSGPSRIDIADSSHTDVILALSAKTAISSGSSLSKSRTISVTNVVKSGCEVNRHRCRRIFTSLSSKGARARPFNYVGRNGKR